MQHGLDLADGTYADQYIGKWGVEHEMTKGHIKKGKGWFNSFDLLQLSFEDELIFGRKPSQLFKEYAAAFKGARQLMWSRGLKDVLGFVMCLTMKSWTRSQRMQLSSMKLRI